MVLSVGAWEPRGSWGLKIEVAVHPGRRRSLCWIVWDSMKSTLLSQWRSLVASHPSFPEPLSFSFSQFSLFLGSKLPWIRVLRLSVCTFLSCPLFSPATNVSSHDRRLILKENCSPVTSYLPTPAFSFFLRDLFSFGRSLQVNFTKDSSLSFPGFPAHGWPVILPIDICHWVILKVDLASFKEGAVCLQVSITLNHNRM